MVQEPHRVARDLIFQRGVQRGCEPGRVEHIESRLSDKVDTWSAKRIEHPAKGNHAVEVLGPNDVGAHLLRIKICEAEIGDRPDRA